MLDITHIHKKFVLIIFTISFIMLLTGCNMRYHHAFGDYTFVNDQYPNGNSMLSNRDLDACLNTVPQQTKESASNTMIEKKATYISGVPGVTPGGIVNSTQSTCRGDCTIARSSLNAILIRCMYDKGWQYQLQK